MTDFTKSQIRKRLLKKAVSQKEKYNIYNYFKRKSIPEEYFELLEPEERKWFIKNGFRIKRKAKIHPIEAVIEYKDPLQKYIKKRDLNKILKVWKNAFDIFELKDLVYLPSLFLYSYHPWYFHPGTRLVPAKYYNTVIAPYMGFPKEKGSEYIVVNYPELFEEKINKPLIYCESNFDKLIKASKELLYNQNDQYLNSVLEVADNQISKFKKLILFNEDNCKNQGYLLYLDKFKKFKGGELF